MEENKEGIDISGMFEDGHDTESETAVSDEDLFNELQKVDPILAMILTKLADYNTVIQDMSVKLTDLNDAVAYLLSKDSEYMKGVAALEAKKAAEETNVHQNPTKTTP